MDEDLAQKAINYALQYNWREAIKTNLVIIKNDSEDIDALNRLAKAYFENGEIDKAKSTSRKVLKLSPNNNIAKNSLDKYSQSKPLYDNKTNPVWFIEEPGKTKLTSLINLGSEKVCSSLTAGDEVRLVTYTHKISVVTINNKYIGKLADDISARLRSLIKEGNKYHVLVKSANKNQVKVFIKGDILSFPLDMSESLNEFDT